jgi:hypothetical protein
LPGDYPKVLRSAIPMIELAVFIGLVVLGLVCLIGWAAWTVLGCWACEEKFGPGMSPKYERNGKSDSPTVEMASDAACANTYSRTTSSGFLSVRHPRKTGCRS